VYTIDRQYRNADDRSANVILSVVLPKTSPAATPSGGTPGGEPGQLLDHECGSDRPLANGRPTAVPDRPTRRGHFTPLQAEHVRHRLTEDDHDDSAADTVRVRDRAFAAFRTNRGGTRESSRQMAYEKRP